MVTQNKSYATKRNRGGIVSSDPKSGFYGSYIEFGWLATGRKKKEGTVFTPQSSHPVFADYERQTLQGSVTTYRGKSFQIGQLREAKKIPGRWVMRNAGRASESAALALYQDEMKRLVNE